MRIAIAMTALLLITLACQPEPDVVIPADPFRAVHHWEDGRWMILEGSTRRYEPGQEAALTVTIQNSTGETWKDGYCLMLVDENGPLAYLGEGRIDLVHEEGIRDTIQIAIPGNAPPGAYGVTLLIPGLGSSTSTVWVGDTDDVAAAPWGMASSCVTGPLGEVEFSIERQSFTGPPVF